MYDKPEKRPGNQNDCERADLDYKIKGQQALPDVWRVDLEDFAQDEGEAEPVQEANSAS
jgi:hypothetical protein